MTAYCIRPGCDNPVEGRTEYCASHNSMFRKLAKQMNRVPKERKQIGKVSEAKELVNQEYSILRKDYLNHIPTCEINLSGCTRRATQIHHCSVSADNFLNTNTWKSTCAQCHRKVETELSAEKRRELQLLYD